MLFFEELKLWLRMARDKVLDEVRNEVDWVLNQPSSSKTSSNTKPLNKPDLSNRLACKTKEPVNMGS